MARGIERRFAGLALWFALAVLPALAITDSTDAALLGLSLGRPDMTIGFVSISYTAGTGLLHATGTVSALDYNGFPTDYTLSGAAPALGTISGNFDISVYIDSLGVPMAGKTNTISVTGSIPSKGINNQVLLAGNLSAFGANNTTGQLFEFRFNTLSGSAGGALAADFGTKFAVSLSSGGVNFDGHFTHNWNNLVSNAPNTGSGTADIAPEVPEPASLCMWSLIGIGLVTIGRCRSRRRTADRFGVVRSDTRAEA